ncbi:electron transfer flavoprotein subunit alpha/FixB family protein [Dyadobacter flavalbus]|uniref:Electron transfer flavoprotein subunit alpha/FixB family protein n=1 Tax=Dyadobacter flavalbus TaxID=2579942 RepID=A0A5M8QUX4_9BACT|nr:electron transfer flavoprotein subunit alpha/FixB family protein [Dyadobacter flavalbus]KAA6439088.1 electron transfer flavoprotein subunit alpha/FixB family protein [Dyadobacter flavalbus]
MSVLIYIELENGSIKKTSLETIAYGAKVAEKTGGKAIVLAIGSADASELEKAGRYGAAKVLHATDQKLEHENSMAYADILVQAVQQENSKVVILAKSGLGDAMAARAAARLKAAVVSGVTQLPETDGVFTVTRSVFSGKAFAKTQIHSEIKILVVKKNVIEMDENAVATENAEIVPFSPAFREDDFKATVVQVEKANTELSLTEADIIVSGGRGMKGPENWQPLVDLARALGAATGCSKPVSDLDWRPHHEHIGQTGIKVAPNLYIACGISGAIQHLAGVNGSKCIVVINKDPEAPFFKAADYGIVGDIFEILPRLTEAAKKLK